MPASSAALTHARVCSSSTLEPNVSHEPRTTSLTLMPLRPSRRYSMPPRYRARCATARRGAGAGGSPTGRPPRPRRVADPERERHRRRAHQAADQEHHLLARERQPEDEVRAGADRARDEAAEDRRDPHRDAGQRAEEPEEERRAAVRRRRHRDVEEREVEAGPEHADEHGVDPHGQPEARRREEPDERDERDRPCAPEEDESIASPVDQPPPHEARADADDAAERLLEQDLRLAHP